MGSIAAIGVREHSGWGVAVAVAGVGARPEVVGRWKIVLLDGALPRQPYHAAAGMPVENARQLVEAASLSAGECAREELGRLRTELATGGYQLVGVGCGVGMTPVQAPFARVMASHALLHAAEGEMYRDAVAEASERLGLGVSRVPWKELWAQAGAELGGRDAREMVARMGVGLGPPWASDQKEACAAASLALALVAGA